MNVTYMIGNGFDLNLGLKTRFSDFLNAYMQSDSSSEYIEDFKKYLKEWKEKKTSDGINWSDTEKAFGEYTEKFAEVNDGGQIFIEQHSDFCRRLADYLNNEQICLKNEQIGDKAQVIAKFCNELNDFTSGLKTTEKVAINEHTNFASGGIEFRFLNFNYTDCLDRIIRAAIKSGKIGTRVNRNTRYDNRIIELIHVHGTTSNGMALGVNDESQIAVDIFDAEAPEMKHQLIKPFLNNEMGENTEEKATKILSDSDVICVYGMSLGDTDARWWERVLQTLATKPQAILIIRDHGTPVPGLLPANHERAVRIIINRLLKYLGNSDNGDDVKKRIFVTGENAFEALKDIAKQTTMVLEE